MGRSSHSTHKHLQKIVPLKVNFEEFQKIVDNIPKCLDNQKIVRYTHLKMNHMFDNNGKKQYLDVLLQGPSKHIWRQALSNYLRDKIITYTNMVCHIWLSKTEKFRVQLTVGGDWLQYPDDTASPAATLLETKLFFNSTISQSTKGAQFMTIDIKDFFCKWSWISRKLWKFMQNIFFLIFDKYVI